MSKSYRKPFTPNSDGASEWKKEANRKIRRNKELDMSNGTFYKKLSDVWDSPMEHKGWWDVPVMRRK